MQTAEPAGQLGLRAGGERAGLLVAHADPLDPVLAADRVGDRVEGVADHAPDGGDAVFGEGLDQQLCDGGHRSPRVAAPVPSPSRLALCPPPSSPEPPGWSADTCCDCSWPTTPGTGWSASVDERSTCAIPGSSSGSPYCPRSATCRPWTTSSAPWARRSRRPAARRPSARSTTTPWSPWPRRRAARRAAGFLHVTAHGRRRRLAGVLQPRQGRGRARRGRAWASPTPWLSALRPSTGSVRSRRPGEQVGLITMRALAPVLGRYRPTRPRTWPRAMVTARPPRRAGTEVASRAIARWASAA